MHIIIKCLLISYFAAKGRVVELLFRIQLLQNKQSIDFEIHSPSYI